VDVVNVLDMTRGKNLERKHVQINLHAQAGQADSVRGRPEGAE
jgi:hypothetical protein